MAQPTRGERFAIAAAILTAIFAVPFLGVALLIPDHGLWSLVARVAECGIASAWLNEINEAAPW